MPLQLSKFTDLPLQFVILKSYHCNFTTLWNTPLLTPSGLVWQLLERIQGRAHPHVGGVDPRWPPDPLHAGVWIPNANLSIWMVVGWRGFERLVCRDGWIRFGCANQWATGGPSGWPGYAVAYPEPALLFLINFLTGINKIWSTTW